MKKLPEIITKKNTEGPVLRYCEGTGVGILTEEGLYFKDLAKDGVLHPFEDWRLPPESRARDLADRMDILQLAGLMLHTDMQMIPAAPGAFEDATVCGLPFAESGKEAWEPSDEQKRWICEDHVRHMLVANISSPRDAAEKNNYIQYMCEQEAWGVPMCFSSDPRHWQMRRGANFNVGSGHMVSIWPAPLGLAAAFDPDIAHRYGEVASAEYRALGITMALSPQADIGSEPRWTRFGGTFGESPELVCEYTRAVCDGMQTSKNGYLYDTAWGKESVAAVVKHWPGGGSCEAGRDAHHGFGKYAVYPGDNLETQIKPFVEGAFKLADGTKKAAAVMPYYSISYGQDPSGENVGNAYSRYIVSDLLRDRFGFEGMVCSDWAVCDDCGLTVDHFRGKPWGMETQKRCDRVIKALEAGVDQFGSLQDVAAVLSAVSKKAEEQGLERTIERLRLSAGRILTVMFRLGLFEDPYIDEDRSREIVGCKEFVEAGLEAQRKSVIMLKNHGNVLPVKKGLAAYIPRQHREENRDIQGRDTAAEDFYYISPEDAEQAFGSVSDAKKADIAVVCIDSPTHGLRGGYNEEELTLGGNGYVPISLQYGNYTARSGRERSIAGGHYNEKSTDRSYRGKTSQVCNKTDLDRVVETKRMIGDKPLIAVLNFQNPTVLAEIEPYCDAIIAHSGVNPSVLLEIITGQTEPSGLLPVQFPLNMETVETQLEDVSFDMRCYTDADGNTYDFGFGMNWNGVIADERVDRFTNKNR